MDLFHLAPRFMSWILALRNFTNDTVRQLQFFMICRQLGVIISSIVLAWFLPVGSVGIFEMLVFAGYLMTFFWSDAFLRGFLSRPALVNDPGSVTGFFLLIFLLSVASMLILVAGQQFLLPVITSRQDLAGLELFAAYQILIVPLWLSPFTGLLKGQNILLASLYVLIGPAFAAWTGYASLPDMRGILMGLFCYALVGFIWVLTKTRFIRNVQLRKLINDLWPVTWPLMLYAVSIGLARSFDAWLVAREFDESTFAVFRYGAREFPLVVAVSVALSTAMIPRLYDNDSLTELKDRSVRVMHSSYPLVATLMLFSPVIFRMVFGDVYEQSAAIFNIYLLLTITQLIFPQSILMARGATKLLWLISIAELAVNVIASVILLQYFGLAGIAFGTLIAFVFEKLVLLYFVRRLYNISPSQIINIPVWLTYAALLAITYIVALWVSGI